MNKLIAVSKKNIIQKPKTYVCLVVVFMYVYLYAMDRDRWRRPAGARCARAFVGTTFIST